MLRPRQEAQGERVTHEMQLGQPRRAEEDLAAFKVSRSRTSFPSCPWSPLGLCRSGFPSPPGTSLCFAGSPPPALFVLHLQGSCGLPALGQELTTYWSSRPLWGLRVALRPTLACRNAVLAGLPCCPYKPRPGAEVVCGGGKLLPKHSEATL